MKRLPGKLRGNCTPVCGDDAIRPTDFDFDSGEVVASGELCIPEADLQRALGRRGLAGWKSSNHITSCRSNIRSPPVNPVE